jgi:PiT family inorganic phosphate transporter
MTTLSIVILITAIVIALIFDMVNGFHDAANSIATIVSTGVLKPKFAVLWAASFNFLAMLFFAPRVAETISKIVKIEISDFSYVYVVLTGLISAIIWDLITWWLGLPTSSSHALIGGFAGSGIANGGWGAIRWDKLIDTMAFVFIAPIMGFLLGFAFMLSAIWILRKWHPTIVNYTFGKAQLISAALYSIGHGANDAQKTMGIIMALLLGAGVFNSSTTLSLSDPHTSWIIISCHAAMAIGTALGGWSIVKTMGMKITKLRPIGGFCAESAGAFTLFLVSYLGIPVSTTHTITGAIVGVGSVSHKINSVRWGIATRIVWAWIFTIPATAAFAAAMFYTFQFIVTKSQY